MDPFPLPSYAAECAAPYGWATCGLRCGPQPDTRHCSLHRGEGERRQRDRPLTGAILRRHGRVVKTRTEGGGGGAGWALTYLRHRLTNAGLEGINAVIQGIEKTAHGFRNAEHFKTAIYFHCGGLDLYPHESP